MTSFFGKLKSGSVSARLFHARKLLRAVKTDSSFPRQLLTSLSAQGPSSPSAHSNKKDGASSNQTPLERMLMNAGPIRRDGSDKFFGMENVRDQLA
jgi:hypothetical protein